jgi:hypothetical protein
MHHHASVYSLSHIWQGESEKVDAIEGLLTLARRSRPAALWQIKGPVRPAERTLALWLYCGIGSPSPIARLADAHETTPGNPPQKIQAAHPTAQEPGTVSDERH